jgi:N-acetylglutamate synthase/N-acetylornithine aminotransferase
MTLSRRSPGKIYMPQGFSFSAACAGIKASGRLDLGLVEAAPRTFAAVFTTNRVVARSSGDRTEMSLAPLEITTT